MKIFFITIFPLFNLSVFSQTGINPVFSSVMLENPSLFIKQYNNIFGYNEISKFKEKNTDHKLILENGYASYIIKYPEAWTNIKAGKKVKSVTFVYTKYPRKRKDWITDYNELLADRLKALFKMDPELNNSDIKWYLLLQTGCKNDKEARTFFHGVVITYDYSGTNINNNTITQKIQKSPNDTLLNDSITITDNNSHYQNQQSRYFIENEFNNSNSFLYRQTIPLTKKKKLAKVPGCPDFSKKVFKKLF